jgi:hypothetical protein
VPGWYSTYWVKTLNDIEVLEQPDTNYWMKTAYTIPDTPYASVQPGETGFKSVPINRMVPRSLITNIKAGDKLQAGAATLARGIAFGGDSGVARVEFSSDGGKSWQQSQLGKDERQIQLPPMATLIHSCGRSTGSDGPMHQQQRRDATQHAELESERLHAQCDRADAGRGGLGAERVSEAVADDAYHNRRARVI